MTHFFNNWFISKFELNFDNQIISIKQKSTATTKKDQNSIFRDFNNYHSELLVFLTSDFYFICSKNMIDKTVKLLSTQCSCGKSCKTSPGYYYIDIAIRKKFSANKHMSAKLQCRAKYGAK